MPGSSDDFDELETENFHLSSASDRAGGAPPGKDPSTQTKESSPPHSESPQQSDPAPVAPQAQSQHQAGQALARLRRATPPQYGTPPIFSFPKNSYRAVEWCGGNADYRETKAKCGQLACAESTGAFCFVIGTMMDKFPAVIPIEVYLAIGGAGLAGMVFGYICTAYNRTELETAQREYYEGAAGIYGAKVCNDWQRWLSAQQRLELPVMASQGNPWVESVQPADVAQQRNAGNLQSAAVRTGGRGR